MANVQNTFADVDAKQIIADLDYLVNELVQADLIEGYTVQSLLDELYENIVLIGPMGAGKTTLAGLIGNTLGQPVVALDDLIYTYAMQIGWNGMMRIAFMREKAQMPSTNMMRVFILMLSSRLCYAIPSILSIWAVYRLFPTIPNALQESAKLSHPIRTSC